MTAAAPAKPLPHFGYLERGISILPLRGDSKRPYGKWRRWMSERMTETQAQSWWQYIKPTPNVGIIGGAISGGLVILDIEPEHVEFVLGKIGDTISTATPRVRTARGGLHLYYNGGEGCGKLRVAGRLVGDVRGEGGYVVAPPSTTPDGAYVWLQRQRWHTEDLLLVPKWAEARLSVSVGSRHAPPPPVGVRWDPSDLDAYLPAYLRRCIHEGFRRGGAFDSPSELDFRVMCEVIHAGAHWDSIKSFFAAYPFGVNVDRHHLRDPNYLLGTYNTAKACVADELDSAVDVHCFRVVSANGRIVGGARTRALVEFLDRDGTLYNHSIPLVLGPPYDGDLSGEWLQVLTAYNKEPTDDPAAIDGNRWIPAIVSGQRVFRLVSDRVMELVL